MNVAIEPKQFRTIPFMGDRVRATRTYCGNTASHVGVVLPDPEEHTGTVLVFFKYTTPTVTAIARDNPPMVEYYPPAGRMINIVRMPLERVEVLGADEAQRYAIAQAKMHQPVTYSLGAKAFNRYKKAEIFKYDSFQWSVLGADDTCIRAIAVVRPDRWIGPSFGIEDRLYDPMLERQSMYGFTFKSKRKTWVCSGLEAVFRIGDSKCNLHLQANDFAPRTTAIALHEELAELERRSRELKAAGLATDKAWIEVAQCHRRKQKQAVWRSRQKIFSGKKSRYIGMQGSKKHSDASASVERRNEHKQIAQRIEDLRIQVELSQNKRGGGHGHS